MLGQLIPFHYPGNESEGLSRFGRNGQVIWSRRSVGTKVQIINKKRYKVNYEKREKQNIKFTKHYWRWLFCCIGGNCAF